MINIGFDSDLVLFRSFRVTFTYKIFDCLLSILTRGFFVCFSYDAFNLPSYSTEVLNISLKCKCLSFCFCNSFFKFFHNIFSVVLTFYLYSHSNFLFFFCFYNVYILNNFCKNCGFVFQYYTCYRFNSPFNFLCFY